jgi:hypothetical protein
MAYHYGASSFSDKTRIFALHPMKTAEQTITELMEEAGIRPNGPNAWDIQVHDPHLYARILTKGSLGFGEYPDRHPEQNTAVLADFSLYQGNLPEHAVQAPLLGGGENTLRSR